MLKNFYLALVVLILVGCGASGGDKDSVTLADTPEQTLDSGLEPELAAQDSTPDLPVGPEVPWGFETRGLLVQRGVVHLHSSWSHDGCSEEGWEGEGDPNPLCLERLRLAPCQTGIDFMMMTDHPNYGRLATFEQGVFFDAAKGDVLIRDEQERSFANQLACDAGSLKENTFVFFGLEGSKQMPVGLSDPVPAQVFDTNYGDNSPLDAAQAAIEVVHELGGYAFCAHTEQEDISLERILALPLDGIEIFNLHAGLLGALDSMDDILGMEIFMDPDNGADPDMSLLPLLRPLPVDVDKFEKATPLIHLASVVATDIHQNVEVPALCPGGGGICAPLVQDYPRLSELLAVGGPLILSDGDRMDSYFRSFRWFSNHVLVRERTAAAIRDAVGTGHSFTVFDVFGAPGTFDFFAQTPEGELVEMGDETTAQTVTVRVKAPTLEAQPWQTWPGVDFSKAEVKTRLIKMTEAGTETLLQLDEQGAEAELEVQGPAALRVQVDITPRHLKPVLGPAEIQASYPFPYIYSNAIFLR